MTLQFFVSVLLVLVSWFDSVYGQALKGLPLHIQNVLPVLLDHLRNPVDILPIFVGSLAPKNGTIQWRGACFDKNEARIDLPEIDRNQAGLGGGIVYVKLTCMDLYVFATPYRVTWNYYFSAKEHTLKFDSWEETREIEYDANIAFLRKHMGATFNKCPHSCRATINPNDVHSGDFLAISKIRGRCGAFETLEKWVTGNLWVGESGFENEKGENVIAISPWDEWWESSLSDSSNPHIALLPLHPDLRSKFNATVAWEYARRMAGKPYGYHNLIFSWIDTKADNYPPPIDPHFIISLMSIWTRVQPDYAANMWNEALNKRLGTEHLDLDGILAEAEHRGIAFEELLTAPEQDDWIYSDGKSTTCVAYILAMYKVAGVFGPISSYIQVTEFTVRDSYMLNIFENNQTRLPDWCNNDNGRLPFCQILGEYWMELPGYNSLEPYANMNEHCPSPPPKYDRPARC